MRDELAEKCLERTGFTPRDWQLDASTALLDGKDCVVIAGTGEGKTLPFVLPCFVRPDITTYIISPLNALQNDQAHRFRKWGLKATSVNARVMQNDKNLLKKIKEGHFDIVITSPENALASSHLRPILTDQKLSKKFTIVIDEAHCISQWGGEFRQAWGKLGNLRSYLPVGVPFLVTSATLPPSILEEVKTSLHVRDDHILIHRGNFRKNLVWETHILRTAVHGYEELADYLLSKPTNPSEPRLPIQTALVYVNKISDCHLICNYLRSLLPDDEEIRYQIQPFHAVRAEEGKCRVLRHFRSGRIVILICTEAAGMGCDFPRILIVIQFLLPNSLISWIQRAGRGGRSTEELCRCILMI
ncbi:P-loop containing nucleoside triphosphate hydrolase protein, partial [Sistotremastrum niveocremeum HHB9708]